MKLYLKSSTKVYYMRYNLQCVMSNIYEQVLKPIPLSETLTPHVLCVVLKRPLF
jgi:hypothetical protein